MELDDPSVFIAIALLANIAHELTTYKQAMVRDDSTKWDSAMKAELEVMKEQDVWTIVPEPKNRNIVASKWVYKIKWDTNENIDRYKARLVAKGFSQQPGSDYDEIFSPVVRYVSLRLLIAISAHRK